MIKMGKKRCPVCKRKSWIILREKDYKFESGFTGSIYDCTNCCARFVMPYRADGVHEELHRKAAQGSYKKLLRLGDECAGYYQDKAVSKYKRVLSQYNKFDFLINYISTYDKDKTRILEVGCAEGYLTGYFLLQGYDAQGIDISETAVKRCRENFGDHFIAGDIRKRKDAEYDVIYHAGLIGEIDFPKEFLNMCIDKLKKGGAMVFNAPNRYRIDSCWTETVPPDLRTLFTARTFQKILERKDADVFIQYSKQGEKISINNIPQREKACLLDWVEYKLKMDSDQYNLYVIIQKKEE